MERSRTDWVYLGRSGVGALLRPSLLAALRLMRATLPRRVQVQRWIRYRIDLTGALPPVAPDVCLTRVTEELMDMLRHHPEQAKDRLRSGLRFWDRGLRRAYVRSEEHTSELQSPCNLVCRLLLEKKKITLLDARASC